MNSLSRVRTSIFVALTPLVCSLLCGTAWAQAEGPPPTSEPANSATTEVTAIAEPSAPTSDTAPAVVPEQRGPMHVMVTLTGYDVDPSTISGAMARDLGMSLTPNESLARCRFVVVAVRGKNLSLTFHGTNGLELQRVVRAPEASADVSEVAALLAVNLVRDEAPELLPLLEPKPLEVKPKAAPTPSQSTKPVAPKDTPKALPFLPANATLVFPLSIMRDVDEHALGFELGLVYSDVGAIDGAGVSAAVIRTRQPSSGALIAGAVSITGPASGSSDASMSGFQISGAANFADGKVDGVQISGAADIATDDVVGAQIAGAASVAWGELEGLQVASAVNVAAGNVVGAQASGAVNYARNLGGFQTSGVANVAHGTVEGAQVAGGVNIASNLDGAQISLVNIANDVNGAQVGLVNIGANVHGAQVGLVNVAEDVNGASVGVVTYSKRGQTQITTWFDSTRPINVGARFVTGPLYAMPSIGTDPRTGDVFDFGLSLGVRIPVERLYFDVDGNSRTSLIDGKFGQDKIDLRYRLTAGFQVTPWLGVFAGGGVHHYFATSDTATQHFKPFWCVGVDLL